jgi:hypothetical protein
MKMTLKIKNKPIPEHFVRLYLLVQVLFPSVFQTFFKFQKIALPSPCTLSISLHESCDVYLAGVC